MEVWGKGRREVHPCFTQMSYRYFCYIEVHVKILLSFLYVIRIFIFSLLKLLFNEVLIILIFTIYGLLIP
ncbi:MAG: hypothetical protein FWC47_16695, partial [Oscillospiraceae bacterium]|nr:hypothetical protein [Oscillospiraceae bacterium]